MISRHPWNLKHLLHAPPVASTAFRVTSNSAEDTTPTTFAVEWWLNEPGTGQLEHGSTVLYGTTTTLEPTLRDYHRQLISGVAAGATVYYRIMSQNAEGEWAYLADSFTMPGTVPTVTVGPRVAPAFPTGANVKHISSSVDDTGTVDVTSQLQAFINTANAGDILVFPQSDPEGWQHGSALISTYKITRRLELRVPNNVQLWGYGTRIRQDAHGSAAADYIILALMRSGMDGLTISGFDLHGSNASVSRTTSIYSLRSGEAAHGIGVRAPHTNTIFEDLWVHHCAADGIYQPVWAELDWSSVGDITVRYCRVEDNKRQGITNNVGDWHIHHTVIGNQGGYSIDAEDNKGVQESLGIPNPNLSALIEDNLFEQTTWAPTSVGGPFGAAVHISATWGWNQEDPPPNFQQLGPFIIRNNTVTGIGVPGLSYSRKQWCLTNPTRTAANVGTWGDYDPIDGVTVEDNTFDLPASEQGSASLAVALRKVTGAIVRNNDFQGCTVDVPTSGYGANTTVTVSGNT